MKAVERIADRLIREQVDIDDIQFGFMTGRGTTDPIFIVKQPQEKFSKKKETVFCI